MVPDKRSRGELAEGLVCDWAVWGAFLRSVGNTAKITVLKTEHNNICLSSEQ